MSRIKLLPSCVFDVNITPKFIGYSQSDKKSVEIVSETL